MVTNSIKYLPTKKIQIINPLKSKSRICEVTNTLAGVKPLTKGVQNVQDVQVIHNCTNTRKINSKSNTHSLKQPGHLEQPGLFRSFRLLRLVVGSTD